jgi:ABC-type multidrug transport system ATPase subunit
LKIILQNIAKKFNKDFVFDAINLTFLPNNFYAINGSNGSGKSTLLQIIAGNILPTSGSVLYQNNSNATIIDIENYISICTPYFELIEEMTATEFLNFHKTFSPFINNITVADALQILGLSKAATKEIRNFSSGMKQRIKLAQAFFSNTSVLLLDEPCQNLDNIGIEIYKTLIENYTKNRIVIICSNDEIEYNFCNWLLKIENNKLTIIDKSSQTLYH